MITKQLNRTEYYFTKIHGKHVESSKITQVESMWGFIRYFSKNDTLSIYCFEYQMHLQSEKSNLHEESIKQLPPIIEGTIFNRRAVAVSNVSMQGYELETYWALTNDRNLLQVTGRLQSTK